MTGEPSTLRVRVNSELWPFLPPRRRVASFEVTHDGDATIGHVVQALRIPLTEVGTLRVNGRPADQADRPAPASTVVIGPVPRPQPAPGERFLLDVHLGTLARRLRLLGIDAAYRNDAGDRELVEQSVRRHRLVLTKDRGLLCRRALWAGGYVRGTRPRDQLADVLRRFAPTLRPWSRCTACNGELEPVAKSEVLDRIPAGTRRTYHRFARCRRCGRAYWRGAHADRLDAIVDDAMAMSAGGARSAGLPLAGDGGGVLS